MNWRSSIWIGVVTFVLSGLAVLVQQPWRRMFRRQGSPGVSDVDTHKIMVDNPRCALTLVAPRPQV